MKTNKATRTKSSRWAGSAIVAAALLWMVAAWTAPIPLGLNAPPKSKDALVGDWVGTDSTSVEFLRLSLEKDGTGLLILVLGVAEPEVWKIKSWQMNGYKIRCTVEAGADRPSEILLSSGAAYLACEVSWDKSKDTFQLLKEEYILNQFKRLRDAANKAKEK